MLACARIGAVHSVVFGGFSADALASRIEDCKARVLITCNGAHWQSSTGSRGVLAEALLAACTQGCAWKGPGRRGLVYGMMHAGPHVVCCDGPWGVSQPKISSSSGFCANHSQKRHAAHSSHCALPSAYACPPAHVPGLPCPLQA